MYKNIAIIGMGKFGTKLFEKFNDLTDIKFICDNKIEDLKKHKIKLSDNYEKILPEIDLAIIATPSNTHYDIAKNCLLNKKNIFIEKPISPNLEEAKELIKIAKEKNLNLYIDNVFLFREAYQGLKNYISDRKIEKIKFTWRKYGTFDDSIFNALLYHDIYLLIDLLKEHEIENIEILNSNNNILNLKFKYNKTLIEFEYDRIYKGKEKIITIALRNEIVEWNNDKLIINNKEVLTETEDALNTMISDFLDNKVNFKENNSLALKTITQINKIKDSIPD